MHLNYFALRHFSNALHHLLKESTFINAFSFSKEEIVFSFLTTQNKELFLAVHLVNKSAYLQLLDNYNRPKRNFLFQFEECNGGIVQEVIQTPFDRSFSIQLKTGYVILFKLHGGFSNIILIDENGYVEDQFKKEFTNDSILQLKQIHKSFDLNLLLSDKIEHYTEVRKIIPLLDEHSLTFLKEENFLSLTTEKRKNLLATYFSETTAPFYLLEKASKSHLQIFPIKNTAPITNPIEAYARLARLVVPSYQFDHSKLHFNTQLSEQIKKTDKQLLKLNKQLENAINFIEYENLGHIIMANMHAIPKQVNKIELFDFYKEHDITIRLDKDLNAQENAEKYYRKSKALKLELPTIQKHLSEATSAKTQLLDVFQQLQAIKDTKSLKSFALSHHLVKEKEEKPILPFREIRVDDFDVWIGKNAANNDLLTFGYAHKNDTWLHAKDVSGSHVIIKNRSGKIITKPTIEKVAAITAYYSKSKSQGLAVVQYTIKKYVVKAKGRNPGEVHLLSEQTILVTPALHVDT